MATVTTLYWDSKTGYSPCLLPFHTIPVRGLSIAKRNEKFFWLSFFTRRLRLRLHHHPIPTQRSPLPPSCFFPKASVYFALHRILYVTPSSGRFLWHMHLCKMCNDMAIFTQKHTGNARFCSVRGKKASVSLSFAMSTLRHGFSASFS